MRRCGCASTKFYLQKHATDLTWLVVQSFLVNGLNNKEFLLRAIYSFGVTGFFSTFLFETQVDEAMIILNTGCCYARGKERTLHVPQHLSAQSQKDTCIISAHSSLASLSSICPPKQAIRAMTKVFTEYFESTEQGERKSNQFKEGFTEITFVLGLQA